MIRFEEAAIATIILAAPGWARVGITAPDRRLRNAAAIELAKTITERFVEPLPEPFDPDQLALTF